MEGSRGTSATPKRKFEQLEVEERVAQNTYELPARAHREDRGLLLSVLDVLYEAAKTRTEPPVGARASDFGDAAVEHAVVCVDRANAAPGDAPIYYECTFVCPLNAVIGEETLDRLRALDLARIHKVIWTGKYTPPRLVIQFHVYSMTRRAPRREIQRHLTTIVFRVDEDALMADMPSARPMVLAARHAPAEDKEGAPATSGILQSVSALMDRFGA